MSEWISIGDACPELGDADATVRRREEVKRLVASGLVKARSFRPRRRTTEFDRSNDLEVFWEVVRTGILDACRFPFSLQMKVQNGEGLQEVSYAELAGMPLVLSEGWKSEVRSDFTISQVKADWRLGHFHRRTLMYSSPHRGFEEGAGFVLMETDAYSVEIESEALTRIAGLEIGGHCNPIEGRGTKYDWEAAFADVAARFYHDIQFDDLSAKGVQTAIIDLLRSSFDGRGLPIPSDDTLKPKARKLLGALRGKKP
jgi:hypothetical protein